MRKNIKVALVHDYIKEFGGAERVLRVLADMYPKAPIYTAFAVKGSTCAKEFKDREIRTSFLAPILKIWKLYSPLRFLMPLIWKTMDLSSYDLVITSSSSYIARGFKVGPETKVVCYCHTPPKFLYGYQTSIEWQKYWPVRVYALIVNHFLRMYDFESAQEVDYWIANSKNVQSRIKKHYRRDSVVIYPPVDVESFIKASNTKKSDYFFVAARLVGGKGLEKTAEVMARLGNNLKIAGEPAGFASVGKKLEKYNTQLLGRVSDKKLYGLYAKAKGFLALERDVDFGITPVEAMAAGTPVIALFSGGYKETIIEGRTGVFIDKITTSSLQKAIKRFEKTRWDEKVLQNHARKFSKERFRKEIHKFVSNTLDRK